MINRVEQFLSDIIGAQKRFAIDPRTYLPLIQHNHTKATCFYHIVKNLKIKTDPNRQPMFYV